MQKHCPRLEQLFVPSAKSLSTQGVASTKCSGLYNLYKLRVWLSTPANIREAQTAYVFWLVREP